MARDYIEIDRDDPRATVTIIKGAFGLWHMVDASGRHYRPIPGDLRAVKTLLRSEGYMKLIINRGGTQRPKYETVYLEG